MKDFKSRLLLHDAHVLAISKPAGVPVQADPTGDEPLAAMVERYCKRPVHLVHRIDRPVSGTALFAKTRAAMAALQAQLAEHSIEKIYLAVTAGQPPEASGRLVHFLLKKKGENAVKTLAKEAAHTERAELEYELLAKSDRYNLLKIKLLTGRHHQIRAQLAAIGCPIKGDNKYGAKRPNADRSIHLHSWKMAFDHPETGQRLEAVAPLPSGDPIWDFFAPAVAELSSAS